MKIISHKIEENKLNDFSREILIQPLLKDIQFQEMSTYVYEMPEE